MGNEVTKLSDMINPEVMADMISAKIPKKVVVTPFAVIDDKLVGVPGNTITVPQYNYIGDAEDVAEGVKAGTSKLTSGSTQVTVKKAVKAVEITDESKLSGYGDPYGQASSQLALSIASKMDADAMTCITGDGVQLVYDGTSAIIGYEPIVNAVDLFDEEFNSSKVMFINPKQLTQLRKDSNFISADKYGSGTNVMITGEVGRIANCSIVPSKRVVEPLKENPTAGVYKLTIGGTATIGDKVTVDGIVYTAEAADDAATAATAIKTLLDADATFSAKFSTSRSAGVISCTQKVAGIGDKPVVSVSSNATVTAVASVGTEPVLYETYYACPIVKLNQDDETEDETPAIKIYRKRAVSYEQDRDVLAKTDILTVDQHYAVSLSNTSKVVLANIKA